MPKYACITLDMEADYGDPLGRVRLLEDQQYFERFVNIVNRHQGRLTMFTVTSLFVSHAGLFQRLAECVPLEYAAHSHLHDPENGSSAQELEAVQSVFKRFLGRSPAGYRAPIGQIDRHGLKRLIDMGYQFDSSIYNSIRPGKYGYFNIHLPNMPFWVTREGRDELLEFPFTSISTVRVVYALSYAKLIGWPLFSTLLRIFGLPDIALLLVHPYNFYTRLNESGLQGLERFALTRNDEKSFDYFEKMITWLEAHDYQFIFMSELHRLFEQNSDLKRIPLETWK